jgi:hypothetical protein
MHTPKRRTLGFAHDEQMVWRYRNGCPIGVLSRDYDISEDAIRALCREAELVGFYEETKRLLADEKAAARLRGRAAANTQSKDRSDECSREKRITPGPQDG